MLGSAIVTMSGGTPAGGFLLKQNFTANRCLPTSVKAASKGGVWLPQPTMLPLQGRACTLVTAAATDASQQQLTATVKEEGRRRYYFIVANARFMLDQEEHFQEQLFERRRHYQDLNLERDFWLVIEPKFLDKFPNITRRLARPAVALVSTNSPWITFMKLRLDRVLAESYAADTVDEALASNSATLDLEFEKPENWVAPYPKYESGWWEPFLPSGSF
ncbi:unnamed protein product [Rhodiola kirilowii]